MAEDILSYIVVQNDRTDINLKAVCETKSIYQTQEFFGKRVAFAGAIKSSIAVIHPCALLNFVKNPTTLHAP